MQLHASEVLILKVLKVSKITFSVSALLKKINNEEWVALWLCNFFELLEIF